jgi:hypothetical protein
MLLLGALGSANVEATGGTVYTSGQYKYHAFTTTGTSTFTVTNGGEVDIFAVAGGGGGGGSFSGGGGGAGGVVYLASQTVTPQGYTITVGAGGAAGAAATNGSQGGNCMDWFLSLHLQQPMG